MIINLMTKRIAWLFGSMVENPFGVAANREKFSQFLRHTSHYDSIEIILCHAPRVSEEKTIKPFNSAQKFDMRRLKEIQKEIQEMIDWIETFPNDEDEEQLPPLNYITSEQQPIINQKLQPTILPIVADIFVFEGCSRYWQEYENPCFTPKEYVGIKEFQTS